MYSKDRDWSLWSLDGFDNEGGMTAGWCHIVLGGKAGSVYVGKEGGWRRVSIVGIGGLRGQMAAGL